MAADSLTKGLGASRLPQIKEPLSHWRPVFLCPDLCGFLQHHLLCLVSAMVSNCFNVCFSHVTSKGSQMRLWIVCSMYICIHAGSKTDAIVKWFYCLVDSNRHGPFQDPRRCKLRLTLWSACSVRTLWSDCFWARDTTSAWHCGVIVRL